MYVLGRKGKECRRGTSSGIFSTLEAYIMWFLPRINAQGSWARRDKDGWAEKWLLLHGAEREGIAETGAGVYLPRNEDSRGEE